MQDMPDSSSAHLKVDLDDILDPDERSHDVEEERRVEHEADFYDGKKTILLARTSNWLF